MAKKILVVDDSAMMRKMIAKVLGENGFDVVGEASTGEQAVDLFGVLRPDVVTMDITMRGLDGLAAAREIKRLDPAARILFLSNLDKSKYQAEVDGVGGLGLVNKHKPADIVKLIEAAG
jgi:two-component system, chemotaxis family, chemotaxis protein CheY